MCNIFGIKIICVVKEKPFAREKHWSSSHQKLSTSIFIFVFWFSLGQDLKNKIFFDCEECGKFELMANKIGNKRSQGSY